MIDVGVLEGNGIGPEITEATLRVLEATGLPLRWRRIPIAEEAVERCGHPPAPEVVRQLRGVKVAIEAPLTVNELQGRITCVQEGGSEATYRSLNNAIRRELRPFVPRPIRGFKGISGAYLEAVDHQGLIGCEYKPTGLTEEGLEWYRPYRRSSRSSRSGHLAPT